MKRSILVTGASSGIGLETTRRLLAAGNHVIGIARNFNRVKIENPDFTAIPLDLSQLETLPQAFSQICREHPEISTLIACAGQGRFGMLETFSFAQIKNLMDLNFMSHVYLVKMLMPQFKRLEHSDIIFMGSEAALQGGKQGTIYCASKFALRGFAQSLRKEGAKSGVRITMINPGMVKTPFFEGLHFEPGARDENYIEASDVAQTIVTVLNMRPGTVIDEINLSPLKKVLARKTTQKIDDKTQNKP